MGDILIYRLLFESRSTHIEMKYKMNGASEINWNVLCNAGNYLVKAYANVYYRNSFVKISKANEEIKLHETTKICHSTQWNGRSIKKSSLRMCIWVWLMESDRMQYVKYRSFSNLNWILNKEFVELLMSFVVSFLHTFDVFQFLHSFKFHFYSNK